MHRSHDQPNHVLVAASLLLCGARCVFHSPFSSPGPIHGFLFKYSLVSAFSVPTSLLGQTFYERLFEEIWHLNKSVYVSKILILFWYCSDRNNSVQVEPSPTKLWDSCLFSWKVNNHEDFDSDHLIPNHPRNFRLLDIWYFQWSEIKLQSASLCIFCLV